MKRKSILVFIVMFYLLSLSLGGIPAKASTINGILSLSVGKKNILIPEMQTINIDLENSTGVNFIQISYKLPSGGYRNIELYRNSTGSFEGTTRTFDTGQWNTASILVFYDNGGYSYYKDIEDGGYYQLDDGNYTVNYSDTTGPVLDNISVDNPSVLAGGSVAVTVDAHDEMSAIQSVYIEYKMPNDQHFEMEATSIGNNQFQLNIPYLMTAGVNWLGKFECVSVTLIDTNNNPTTIEDYSYYSTRDLNGGDFIVKPESDAPLLKTISVDNKEITSGESLKVSAEVEDASGVSEVKATFQRPDGSSYTAILNHSYGNVYEGEIPGDITSASAGNWNVYFVWVNDIYNNSSYIWSNWVYWWGEDLSNGNFYVKERDTTPPNPPSVYEITENDSYIYGYAEPGTLIQAELNGNVIASANANDSGYYYFYIGQQNSKSKVYVTATDTSGNVSQQTQLSIRDVTPPEKPIVGGDIYDYFSYVSGRAEPGSTVRISVNGSYLASGVTSPEGYFSIYTSEQKPWTELSITATDESGNESEPSIVVVLDKTNPTTPLISKEVSDHSDVVIGQAEAGTTVEVKKNKVTIGSSQADYYGNFSVSIPVQRAGTELHVVSTDSGGNSSGLTIYVKDKTPPIRPFVIDVTDKDTSVTVQAEAGAIVEVKVNDLVIGTGKAGEDSKYQVSIPVQKAGTELTITAADESGNISEAANITVLDATPPATPELSEEVTDHSVIVTGVTEAGSKVEVKKNNITIGSSQADYYGNFAVSIPVQLAGTKLHVVSTDESGNASSISIFVKDKTPPVKPSLKEVTDKDTFVTGQAEVGSKVDVKVNEVLIGTGTAGQDFKYIVTIPIQKAGSEIVVSATDASGNVSEGATTVVKDVTAPAKPEVVEVTDKDTFVSGQAESGSTVKVNGNDIFQGTTGVDGKFKVTIPMQKAGTELVINVIDKAGNISEEVTTVVKDGTAPVKPVVNEVTDKDTSVIGKAEAGSKVEVKVNDSVIGTGAAGEDGQYKVTIPTQKAGTELVISATDKAGNVSETTTVVVKDVTAPVKPEVNEVNDKDTTVIGKAEPGAKVEVKINDSVIGIGTAGEDGQFKVTIPTQKAGTELVIISTDNVGNVSETTTVVVKDVTAPVKPEVNEVTDKDTTVTGKAEAGSKVEVKVNDSVIATGTAEQDGQYKVSIRVQKAGTVLEIIATDSDGNQSEGTTIKVIDKTAPTVLTVNTVSDKSKEVTGKTEAGATVSVLIGTRIYAVKADTTGNFKVIIPVQKAGTKLILTAKDAAGNVSAAKSITVLDKTAPVAPTVSTITDLTKVVTGKAEAGAIVTVTIGTKKYIAKADAKGSFKVTIPVQKAGTKVIVTAKDAAGNVSVAKSVIVIDKTAPSAPKIKTTVRSTTKEVTGTSESYSTITIKVGSKVIGTTKADSKGNFKVKIKAQKKNTILSVTATDKAKNVSKAATVKVK
ncbi:Ig-like domain-containing protein [Neobacillus drentensis]|uniref:Ig-like domain-containing protein n=1 Tax=Neobacillus drentensis TaxID=220684 RepID=UPI00300226D4